MTGKRFFDVFSTLSVTDDDRELLEEARITKLVSSSRHDKLHIYLASDHIIPKDRIYAAEREIRKQYYKDSGVSVKIIERFSLGDSYSPKVILKLYKNSILTEASRINPAWSDLLAHADFDISDGEDSIVLVLEDRFLARDMADEMLEYLDHAINVRCGTSYPITVEFKEREIRAGYEQLKKRMDEPFLPLPEPAENNGVGDMSVQTIDRPAQAEPPVKDHPAPPKDRPRRRKAPANPDVIFGRDFTDEPMRICDIEGDIGEVTIRGQVDRLDTRDTKTGKKLVMFSVTDFTDTIDVKMFPKEDQQERLFDYLKDGSFIQIKGVTGIDKFDNVLTLGYIHGIKKSDDFRVKREDRSDVKRVELHCHTKMSDMDGVSSVADIIDRAVSWGHDAIAITDHGVVQAFTEAFHHIRNAKINNIKIIYGMEGYIVDDEAASDGSTMSDEAIRKTHSNHIILLAANETGRVNLYRLVSVSHLNYVYRGIAKIPKSLLRKYREGIIIGSACEQGEIYQAIITKKSEDELIRIAEFYDYLEIQPNGNNAFMIREDRFPDINSVTDLEEINKKIIELADRLEKPVVATCDVHFLNPEDEVYRRVLMAGKGFKDADLQAPLFLRTTEEMLAEFEYLGEDRAYEIVVTNTRKIADMIENIEPVRPDKCPPVIPDSDKTLTDICYTRAKQIYGDELPSHVKDRLDRELNSIIKNGFAVMYMIAQKLVKKSNEDGYLVGSRGSVGSSFVATMAGITEVNPLPPHYYCSSCHFSDFDSPEVKEYAGRAGCDMPDRICPVCGSPLKKEGFDIPFETFLGFKGDKEPDIDLNFSGEYQSKAHKYTEVIFGKGQTFRAGTIGTIADKTAYGFVKKYYEERHEDKRPCELDRLAKGCTGVRRTTGQHPGGIIVLPKGEDIYSFTPIQHPADDITSDIITTHFDYHSIDHNLLKLDILGHDDPTMIKMLQDLTGTDPRDVALDDPGVMSLFESTEALGIKPDDIGGCKLGCLGIPEFGTENCIRMVLDAKPKHFSDLVRISGLGHGEGVWKGNAQELIKDGKATISTAICTRDDIMTYLINMGIDSSLSFNVMEMVRKGKVAAGKCEPWNEWKEQMTQHNVPDWYIWSCEQIQYMFPKAHAAAYVMMAWRIAYYKINYPLEYYAAYFSIRASGFSYEIMCRGRDVIDEQIAKYSKMEEDPNIKLKAKDENILRDLKIAREMYARGFEFMPIDIYRAKAHNCIIVDNKIMPRLDCIDGLGDKAADGVTEAAKDGAFLSLDDFCERTKVSRSVMTHMVELGLLSGLPESNQLSLFDMLRT